MFALSPDRGPPYDGLPRLIRFEKLGPLVIATLDREKNLLRVDPERYSHLSDDQKDELIRTHSTVVLLDLKTPPPSLRSETLRVPKLKPF